MVPSEARREGCKVRAIHAQQPFRLAFGNPPSRAVVPALRSGNAPNNGAFLSSQVAKSPPGSLQESTCSPLAQGRLTYGKPLSSCPKQAATPWRCAACAVHPLAQGRQGKKKAVVCYENFVQIMNVPRNCHETVTKVCKLPRTSAFKDLTYRCTACIIVYELLGKRLFSPSREGMGTPPECAAARSQIIGL